MKMKKLNYLPLLICLALFSGAALLYYRWPYYELAIVAAIVSVPFLLLLSRKWTPLFLFTVLLGSLGLAIQAPAAAFTSIGTYFLLTVFQFSLWSTAEQFKQITEQTVRLKQQHHALLQSGGELRALELQEFIEQTLWLLKTNNDEKQTWLMEVTPTVNCAGETAVLERAALNSVIPYRDLVTSRKGTVYLLVKETDEHSVQPLLQRLEKAVFTEDQFARYEIKTTAITKVCEMGSLLN